MNQPDVTPQVKYEFVEIGTSCFETMIGQWTGTGNGISVEPIGEYLDILPNPPGVIKVRAAVSDGDGRSPFFWIPHADIHGLPLWLAGCNCLERPHPTAMKYLKKRGLMELMNEIIVPVISPGTLLDTHYVAEVGYLKIDAEGHDATIVMAWLDACLERGLDPPSTIVFENNSLSDPLKMEQVLRRLRQWTYRLERQESDIRATRVIPC